MVSVWSFPTEERAQQNHASHSHARQQPAVEALLALPALGCCIVPVEFHKSVLQGKKTEGTNDSSDGNVYGCEGHQYVVPQGFEATTACSGPGKGQGLTSLVRMTQPGFC